MTVIHKQTEVNPWEGKKFIISRQYRYVKDDRILDQSQVSDMVNIPEKVEISSKDEFQRKLYEIKNKNQFLKDLAVQENREIYAQLIIQEL